MVYGMTGGQVAPTTPFGTTTTTTPYGSFEHPVDAVKLAMAAGAAYSARWTTAHPKELKESIKKAFNQTGFRFIEAVTQCPVGFGRRSGYGDAGAILKQFRERAVSVEESGRLTPEELDSRIVVGEFFGRHRQTLNEAVEEVSRRGIEVGRED
jgi:2-oxoglutarate ferredoxin oxidoreductase subunit beta